MTAVQIPLFATQAIAEQHRGLPPGTEVGAHRWPCHANHPDCWGRPWKGTVLRLDDPRAWKGTGAFPNEGDLPDPVATTAHVYACLEQGYLRSALPVLWDFGDEQRVYFERKDALRPYPADLAEWRAERAAAYAREAGLRAA